MASLNYSTVGSNNLDAAKRFYDALLGSIGMNAWVEHPSGGRVYRDSASIFGVLGPHDQKPATVGNGSMVGFCFNGLDEVAAFHAKAIGLGATTEGDPGERMPGCHFAYFRDLDGNKICAYSMP